MDQGRVRRERVKPHISDSQVSPCQITYSRPQNVPEIANRVTWFWSRGQPKRLNMHFHLPRELQRDTLGYIISGTTKVLCLITRAAWREDGSLNENCFFFCRLIPAVV